MARAEPYGDIPRFKSILFGCDNWGTILDEYGPYKNEEGVWMKKYFIIPDPHLLKNYPWLLEEGRMTNTRYGPAIWVEYPYDLINEKSTSKTNAIARVYCAFDGGETHETERFKEYIERLKNLERENNHLKESNAYYIDMLGNALKTYKIMAADLAEILDIMSRGGKKGEQDQGEESKG